VNEAIKTIFGNSVCEESFTFPAGTPNYIRYGYDAERLIWNQKSCLHITPKSDSWNLAALKKHLKTIETACGMPTVVQLNRLTALQRTNLIESGVAFVSGKGQVFIPFWGSFFEEKILNPPQSASEMTAAAQMVFLYLIYQSIKGAGRFNQTQLSKALSITKPTCTRAVHVLSGLNLVTLCAEGTANWVSLPEDPKKMLNSAFGYLRSPVQRRIYIKALPTKLICRICGHKALAARSMLAALPSDAGYAVSKSVAKELDHDLIIDEQTFRDFGGETIEVWNYDPLSLTESEYVDDLSLLLELGSDADERVQSELDAIRNEYGINGGTENGRGN